MKKTLTILMAISMVMSLSACQPSANNQGNTTKANIESKQENQQESKTTEPTEKSTESTTSDYPTGPITLYVSSAAGGSFDLGVRLLVPYVEEELGTTINIVNNDTAGGWAIWLECAKAKGDGYSIYTNNFPAYYTVYNPEYGYDVSLEDFQLIANFCSDPNIVVTSKDSGIETLEQLIDYTTNNKDIVCGVTTFAGDDHLAYLKMVNAIPSMGENTTPLYVNSITEAIANQLGGFSDFMFCNVGNIDAVKEKCNIICVFSEERCSLVPEIPTFNECAKEIGFDVDVSAGANRGFWMPTGCDDMVTEKIITAFKNALNREELKQAYREQNFVWNGVTGNDYVSLVNKEDTLFRELLPLLGWE